MTMVIMNMYAIDRPMKIHPLTRCASLRVQTHAIARPSAATPAANANTPPPIGVPKSDRAASAHMRMIGIGVSIQRSGGADHAG